jgi:plasmid stabilization system protein ParE
MDVRWTETEVRHLTAIHGYIARDSPIYARRMVDRLTRRPAQIAEFPTTSCDAFGDAAPAACRARPGPSRPSRSG